MTIVLPINLPSQQLPQPTDRLSDGFLREFGRPSLLTLPSKLALAAADFSGLRNFGSLSGGVVPTANGWGTLGAAWKFDGTGTITKSSPVGLSPTNVVTVAVLVNFLGLSPADFVCFAGNSDVNSNYGYRLWSGANSIMNFNLNYFGSNVATITVPIDSNWHLLAGVADGANSNIYWDGVAGTPHAETSTINYTSASWFISPNGGWVRYNGLMALAAVWSNVALTTAQVTTLYSCLRTGEPFPLFARGAMEGFYGSAAAVTAKTPWHLLQARAA